MPFTPKYYPDLKHFNQQNAIWGVVRWLVDDQTSVAPNAPTPDTQSDPVLSTGPAGPAWKIIECRSNGGRYQPGSPPSGDGTLSGISDTGEGIAHNWRLGATWAVNEITVTGGSASPGDLITINGNVLTAVSGAAGVDEFDVASGSTTTIVANIVAAVIDPLNSYDGDVTAVDADPDVEFTAVTAGPAGNLLTLTTDNAPAFAITEPTFFGVLEDEDWIVLETVRESILGATALATGSVTPTTGATAPTTITLDGVVLTGVAGARTPGSDDFDMSLGSVALLTAEITAAINDGANSFTTTMTAVDGTTDVDLTAESVNHPGATGNLLTLAARATSVTYTVSGPVLTGGNWGEECQLLFGLDGGEAVLEQCLIPYANFTSTSTNVGVSSLTLPSDSFGEGLATLRSTTIAFNINEIMAVADEGMLAIFWDPYVQASLWFRYYGDVDNPHPIDKRPFVMREGGTAGDQAFEAHWTQVNFTFFWYRISPVDDTTLLNDGHEQTAYVEATFLDFVMIRGTTWGLDSRLGTRQFFPVGVIFMDPGHEHQAGWLKNVYEGHGLLGIRGSSGARDYIWRWDENPGTTGLSPIVLKWDGITPV